ncbi:MAG: sugar ABC transporter substrate-binding protein [Epulopiscium sp. Nele67-Bin004]|nr:MAG: sugar ABC transporter substrate-binding protein [Epulopiscium sp. Nele67-Bin004]
MNFRKIALFAMLITGLVSCAQNDDKVKIGFLVKQAEEPWFQTEWAFADKAGEELGFEVVKIAIPDSEKTLSAIDTLASQGVKGFMIVTPDTRLGPAIMAKANANGQKVITVDDRFLDANNNPMQEVPFLGMDAYAMGDLQGKATLDEAANRGWNLNDVTVLLISFDELDTSVERNNGALDVLKAAGVKDSQIVKVAQKWSDTPSALEAALPGLASVPNAEKFFIIGFNDNTAIGGVRATENFNIPAENVIAIGINGTDVVDEFQKDTVSGLHGSMLLSPDLHGYETAKMMYAWLTEDQAPPLYTPVRTATLITRDNYESELKNKGMWQGN